MPSEDEYILNKNDRLKCNDSLNMADAKSTLLNPRAYIYQYSKISPKEGRKYVQKYVQKSYKVRKKVDNGRFDL